MCSFTIEQEMSMAPPVSSAPVTTTSDTCNATGIEQCSTTPLSNNPNIKQEKHDERLKLDGKLSSRQQTSNTSIAFSITNILSNTFGNANTTTAAAVTTKFPTNNNNQINRNNNNKVISEKKNSVLFRPYDDDCGGENGGATSPKQAKLDHRRQQSDDEESNGEFRMTSLKF